MSEEIKTLNLHQKLVEIRKEIDTFTKDTKGFNYSYVSGSQVLSKIKNRMDELGVLLYPKTQSVEHSTYDYKQFNKKTKNMDDKTDFVISGDLYYIWVNADNPSEKLEVEWKLFGQQDDISKAFGSALTYSERYFLLKFFNAPTDDDDPDTRQGSPKSRGVSSSGKATEAQMKFVNNLIKGKVTDKFNEQQVIGLLKQRIEVTKDMDDWSPAEASKAIKFLQGDGK